MAIVALPIDASSGSPAFTAQQTRQALSALTGVAPPGRPLGAFSGVRSGTPPTTVSLSGTGSMTWNLAAHSGVLDVETSATAGPYFYATDGTDTGTITAQDPTNPRVDIIYVQVDDTVQDGSGLRQGVVGYLAGTPAGTPTAPATPARSLVIAQINVPRSGGGAPTATWTAPVAGAQPTCVVFATAATGIGTSATAISFGSASINVGNMWSSGTNVTIAIPGTYAISGKITFAGSGAWAAGKFVQAQTMVNGTSVEYNSFNATGTGTLGSVPVPVPETIQVLNVGDVVTLSGLQNFGGTFNDVSGALYTSLTVRRVGD